MADKEKIGVVGTGRMGLAITKHLIKHGYAVVGQDIDAKAIDAARAAGAEAVKTPAEVGKAAKFVIVAVGYDEEAAAVMLDKGGLLETMGPGSVDLGVVHLHAGPRQDAGGTRPRERRRPARCADLPRADGGRRRHHVDPVRRQRSRVQARRADPAHASPPTSCCSATSAPGSSARR